MIEESSSSDHPISTPTPTKGTQSIRVLYVRPPITLSFF